MSTVCVLTPIVVGSWPMIAAAVASAASALGFTVAGTGEEQRSSGTLRVETEVPDSQVVAENLSRGQRIRIEREGIAVEFGVDERGRCTVCVTGEGHSRAELKRLGDEVAGRVIQQFAYHKLMTELKRRNFRLVEESLQQDQSIQLRVRLDR